MFKLLGILFFGVIALLLLGIALLGRILGGIFGIKPRSFHEQDANARQQSASGNAQASTAGNATARRSSTKREKLFAEDEGEYVDYEEVKEDGK